MSATDESTGKDTNPTAPSTPPSIIPITSHHHLPIKLTTTNYPIWRAHLLALLNGYALTAYIKGANPDESLIPITHWFQQDQLLLSAILGSTSSDIQPLISHASTSCDAWEILSRTFASTSRQRVMQLKTELARATIGSRSVGDFINYIKAKTDELSLIDEPVKADDLTLYVINGLGSNFRDIVGPIRTRETPLRFEELRDHLVEHELLLRNMEAENANLMATANVAQASNTRPSNGRSHAQQPRNSHGGRGGQYNQNRGGRSGSANRGRGRHYSGFNNSNGTRPLLICQQCALPGHTAPYCRQINASAHAAYSPQNQATQSSWLVDSGASHNLTNELGNLSIHSEYDGTDELQIADGSGLPISHTGSHNGGATGNRPV